VTEKVETKLWMIAICDGFSPVTVMVSAASPELSDAAGWARAAGTPKPASAQAPAQSSRQQTAPI
jgi:hypothetical protein